ncbi:hypothetical protein LY632_08425 [Erythrobacter sp. SDW2]|uniref:hypothetical protein n=1 Tax=Erythrobacter sp. SDW2 TaxID=2907154 RepID=UPI001F3E8AD5|nr:hypothetical protein [Erythrobacter sp. SDW2]UIP05735.1 hypothetical protein LY632_08425 [Erythrobacter sp. SDW2]
MRKQTVKIDFTLLTLCSCRLDGDIMDSFALDQLPPVQRLALAYAPGPAKAATGAVFALDTRLSQIGRQSAEPLITQMKLAWWRDQFANPASAWAKGEPLLAVLAEGRVSPDALAELVNGWEAVLIGEELNLQAVKSLAEGRVAAWCGLGHRLGCDGAEDAIALAARRWTYAEVAGQIPPGDLQDSLRRFPDATPVRLPKTLRPLVVLDGLGLRALRQRAPLLDGPAALVAAMRLGIFGR